MKISKYFFIKILRTIIDAVNNAQSYLISIEDVHKKLVDDLENKIIKEVDKQFHYQK